MPRYIDAEKLKSHIKDLPTWWADDGGVYGQSMKYPEGMFDCDDIINSIDNQPTADVEEVKHGEWKKISVASEHGYGQVYYQHSSCEINSTELFQCPYERCPRCGAKMDGGKKR